MSELYKPSPNIEVASPEFLTNPTNHEFSPEMIDRMQFALAQYNVDLETPHGKRVFVQMSKGLYCPYDPNHGWPHIDTVMSHSYSLAKIHEMSEQEVYTMVYSACLHDVVRYDVNNPAILSAEIAEMILAPYMTPYMVQSIVDVIAQHSSGAMKRYSRKNRIVSYFYDADKGHTNRWRWEIEGLNPLAYTLTEEGTIAPIEEAYSIYLDLVMGTVVTSYTSDTIQWLILEQEALKNASGY